MNTSKNFLYHGKTWKWTAITWGPITLWLQGWIVADVKMGTRLLCWKVVEMITEVLRLEFTHWYWVLCQKEFPNFACWSPVFSTGKVRKFLWVPLTVYLAACRSFKQRVAKPRFVIFLDTWDYTEVTPFLQHLDSPSYSPLLSFVGGNYSLLLLQPR